MAEHMTDQERENIRSWATPFATTFSGFLLGMGICMARESPIFGVFLLGTAAIMQLFSWVARKAIRDASEDEG